MFFFGSKKYFLTLKKFGLISKKNYFCQFFTCKFFLTQDFEKIKNQLGIFACLIFFHFSQTLHIVFRVHSKPRPYTFEKIEYFYIPNFSKSLEKKLQKLSNNRESDYLAFKKGTVGFSKKLDFENFIREKGIFAFKNAFFGSSSKVDF